MRMNGKIFSLVTAGLFLTACAKETPMPTTDAGSTYVMPNTSGKGTYSVMMNGKKGMSFEATDLDIITQNAHRCCDDGQPKEAAILKSNREMEIKIGNITPNIRIDDIDVWCDWDNPAKLIVEYQVVVSHAGGEKTGFPMVDVPVFLTAMDIPSGEVYSNMNAMMKVDLNKLYDIQTVRVMFDTSDLKARGLNGWSFVTGIMKSAMNRAFESDLAREREHKIAEAGGSYEMNTSRAGDLPETTRYSEDRISKDYKK